MTRGSKKTLTKKQGSAAAPDQLMVREDEAVWTRAELDEVVEELHEDRNRLAQAMRDRQAELADLLHDSGEGAGQDQTDRGSTSFELDHEYHVVNNEQQIVTQIDRALSRIADGTYGQCASCDGAIGKLRLQAFPRATLCMSCKQREERH